MMNRKHILDKIIDLKKRQYSAFQFCQYYLSKKENLDIQKANDRKIKKLEKYLFKIIEG